MNKFYDALNVLRGDLDNCVYIEPEPDITATLSVTLDGNYSVGNNCPGVSQLGFICFISEFDDYVDLIHSDYRCYKADYESQSKSNQEDTLKGLRELLSTAYRPEVGETFRFVDSTAICTLTAYGDTLFLYKVDGKEYGKSIEHTKFVNINTPGGKRKLIYNILKEANCRNLDKTYETIVSVARI